MRVIWIFMLLCVNTLAQANNKFDQDYAKWHAQQQAIDARLKAQQAGQDPNYYLSKPSLAKSGSTAAMSSGPKVNINRASVTELQQLSGVGQKKAEAIIQYREQNGSFKTVNDLQNVKGIGPKLLEKNRARLAL
jgi:competence protein ComEA